MERGSLTSLAALAFLASAAVAEATPVRWELDHVTFVDGGTAEGSFVFDAATNRFTDVGVNTTAGSRFSGQTYSTQDVAEGSSVDPFWWSGAALLSLVTDLGADLTGSYLFVLSFAAPLGDAGGTVGLNTAFPLSLEGRSLVPDASELWLIREVLTGALSGTPAPAPVPEPGTLALLGSGLFGVAGSVRNRRSHLGVFQGPRV